MMASIWLMIFCKGQLIKQIKMERGNVNYLTVLGNSNLYVHTIISFQLSDHEEENEGNQPATMVHMEEEEQLEPSVAGTVVSSIEDRHYDELAQLQQHLDDDVEMMTTVETTGGADDKSSSFPFSAVVEQHSETSDDLKERRTEDGVDTSLLASLAGDNANSLPSVGGNDESDTNKKAEFESNVVHDLQPLESKLNSSEDSSSHHAIAESLGDENDHDMDTSNATIVNTEIISEDELPPPSKAGINDAEEVSDEELPAPQRAELPADAEVISEDELPAHNNNNASESRASGKRKAGKDKDSKTIQSKSGDEEHDTRDTNFKEKSSEQYNPGSPTTESNDAPPVEKRARVDEGSYFSIIKRTV